MPAIFVVVAARGRSLMMAVSELQLTLCIGLPVLCALALIALCCLCRSKRYRLNWYQRNLLDGLPAHNEDDSEQRFLHTSSKQSQTSLDDNSTSTVNSIKAGLPSIKLGSVNPTVVTRKIKPHQDSDSSDSMGSTNSHDVAKHAHIKHGGIAHAQAGRTYSQHSAVIHGGGEKRVSFKSQLNGAGMSRRSSTHAPVLPGGRRGSGSTSSGSGDGRRESAEFWVPPTVLQKKQRAQSLVPSLGLMQRPAAAAGATGELSILSAH